MVRIECLDIKPVKLNGRTAFMASFEYENDWIPLPHIFKNLKEAEEYVNTYVNDLITKNFSITLKYMKRK